MGLFSRIRGRSERSGTQADKPSAKKYRRLTTLREIDPVGYEGYRFLLDLIYNSGGLHKDHYKLKDRVDSYIVYLLKSRPKLSQQLPQTKSQKGRDQNAAK